MLDIKDGLSHFSILKKIKTNGKKQVEILYMTKDSHFGDSAGIQTQDLQNRNLTLYSAKLRNRS